MTRHLLPRLGQRAVGRPRREEPGEVPRCLFAWRVHQHNACSSLGSEGLNQALDFGPYGAGCRDEDRIRRPSEAEGTEVEAGRDQIGNEQSRKDGP